MFLGRSFGHGGLDFDRQGRRCTESLLSGDKAQRSSATDRTTGTRRGMDWGDVCRVPTRQHGNKDEKGGCVRHILQAAESIYGVATTEAPPRD